MLLVYCIVVTEVSLVNMCQCAVRKFLCVRVRKCQERKEVFLKNHSALFHLPPDLRKTASWGVREHEEDPQIFLSAAQYREQG